MDPDIERNFMNVDQMFSVLFLVDCLLKIVVLRRHYFSNTWNKLDFSMTVLDVGNIVVHVVLGRAAEERVWVRVVKSLRILRSLRLLKSVESIALLLHSIVESSQAILNVGLLTLLCMVVYAIIGVNFFATVKIQPPLDPYNLNFQTFENAFLILFRASTGENWHYIMYGVGRPRALKFQCSPDEYAYAKDLPPNSCGNMYLSIFYFVTFLLFVNKIIMNLFIAVVLNAYNEAVMSKQDIINEDILQHYQQVWLKFDPSGKGFIHKD